MKSLTSTRLRVIDLSLGPLIELIRGESIYRMHVDRDEHNIFQFEKFHYLFLVSLSFLCVWCVVYTFFFTRVCTFPTINLDRSKLTTRMTIFSFGLPVKLNPNINYRNTRPCYMTTGSLEAHQSARSRVSSSRDSRASRNWSSGPAASPEHVDSLMRLVMSLVGFTVNCRKVDAVR